MPTSGKRPLASLKEADLKGKKVFVRVDLNVPLDDNLQVTDDTRIRSVDMTVKYLIKNGAKTILASHLVNSCDCTCYAYMPTFAALSMEPCHLHSPNRFAYLLQGRPKKGPEAKFSLKAVVRRLSEVVGTKVRLATVPSAQRSPSKERVFEPRCLSLMARPHHACVAPCAWQGIIRLVSSWHTAHITMQQPSLKPNHGACHACMVLKRAGHRPAA